MRRFPWWAATFVALIVLIALLVPFAGLPAPLAIAVNQRFGGPSLVHLLGQDELGRDELSRLLWGSRASLAIALASATVGCALGTFLGVAAGFFRGVVEATVLRATDALLCFPPLLLALLVVTLMGVGFGTLIPLMGFIFLPGFIRVAYASVLSVRSQEYVEAMRVLGARWPRVIFGTILPNVAGPLLVQFSLTVAAAITLEAGLSFIGLAQDPLLLLWPCIALTITIVGINMLCDGLRDVLDPQGHARRAVRQPRLGRSSPPVLTPGLDVQGLTVGLTTETGCIQPVCDLAFSVAPGQTLALVGESGSGKSMTAMALAGLLPANAFVSDGAAWLNGVDLLRQDKAAARALRGKMVGIVFQDPGSSLNPVQSVGTQVAEAIRVHDRSSPGAVRSRVIELLTRVGIPDPARRAAAYPHELSGGMRQRVMIAIAIANNPRLIIADEPTTALDVTIQAQILELLAALQRQEQLALIFITHNLPVVAEIADTVAVMYAGEVVERGAVGQVFARPLHPYTRALLASAPSENGATPEGIPGNVPRFDALPAGCRFAPRCASRTELCETTAPALKEVQPDRLTRCFRWREFA
jgi:peptide/nickel transport system permease protein